MIGVDARGKSLSAMLAKSPMPIQPQVILPRIPPTEARLSEVNEKDDAKKASSGLIMA